MRQVIDECAARAEFGDVPGGATGLLIKDYKGKDADQPVYKVDSGLLPSCAPTSIGRPRNWSSGRRMTTFPPKYRSFYAMVMHSPSCD